MSTQQTVFRERTEMGADPVRLELLRTAAAFGPGYRGNRSVADETDLNALLERFDEQDMEIPAYLRANSSWVDREAKLFETGDYPDKGVTISGETLKKLEATFDLPVPIWIEHADSPLEIGFLTNVRADGDELFGTLTLTEEANRLVEKSGARSLSLGLAPDLDEIQEVSLVRQPRVESARMYSARVRFDSQLQSVPVREVGSKPVSGVESMYLKQRNEEAIRSYVRQGRLTPAQARFASAILDCDGAVEFGGGPKQIGQLLFAMIESQPSFMPLVEQAPASSGRGDGNPDLSSVLMLPEEAEFYRRHFPDVSLEEIARRRAR